jgi:hypothetical protein
LAPKIAQMGTAAKHSWLWSYRFIALPATPASLYKSPKIFLSLAIQLSMGNSSSKISSANSSSSSLKSRSLAHGDDQTSGTQRRLSSTTNNATSTLAVPGSSSHRRSRSANAAVDGAPPAPPPPYSAAINTPSSVSPRNITAPAVTRTGSSSHRATAGMISSNGSRYTQIYMILAGTSSSRTAEYLRAPMRRESVENALETLRKYDTVIIVDDSSSMRGKRWQDVSLLTLRLGTG